MSRREEINAESPDLSREIQDKKAKLMKKEDIDRIMEEFENQIRSMDSDLYEFSMESYHAEKDILKNEYGKAGTSGDHLYSPDDVRLQEHRKSFQLRSSRTPAEHQELYGKVMNYINDLEEQEGYYHDLSLKTMSMVQALKQYEGNPDTPEVLTTNAAALREQMEKFEQDTLKGSQIAWYKGCRNAADRLMNYAWNMNPSDEAQEENAYKNPQEIETLAQDMAARGIEFDQVETMAKGIFESDPVITTHYNMVMEASDDHEWKVFETTTDHTSMFQDLSDQEREFARNNFDRAFREIFPDDKISEMQSQGKDMFDMIYVEGVSLNEKYGSIHENAAYYQAVDDMKFHLISEILQGKNIQIVTEDHGELNIVPLETEITLPGKEAGSKKESEKSLSELLGMITESQNRLKEREDREIRDARNRMQNNRPLFPPMGRAESGVADAEIVESSEPQITQDYLKQIYNLHKNIDVLAGKAEPANENQRDEMITCGNQVFACVFQDLGINEEDLKKYPVYQQMGVRSPVDLVYIDGIRAADYFEQNHMAAGSEEERKAMVSALITGGEHHIDFAKVGMDAKGNFEVGVLEIHADLHPLDKQERFYQKSRSSIAEKVWKDDPEERQRRIHDAVGQDLVVSVKRSLGAQRNPYNVEAQKFENKGAELTNTYFKESDREILANSVEHHKELGRGEKEYGGSLRLAQLYLMNRHPEIRYADLMDPEKFRKEKLEAGAAVAEAVDDFRLQKEHDAWEKIKKEAPGTEGPEPVNPTFEKLGVVLAEASKGFAKINLRDELAYSLGLPKDVSSKDMKEALKSPRNSVTANTLFASMSLFGQSAYQAIGAATPDGKTQEFHKPLDPEKCFKGHAEMMKHISAGELKDAVHARNILRRGLEKESQFLKPIRGSYEIGAEKMAIYRTMIERSRDLIMEYGEAKNIPLDLMMEQSINTVNAMEDRMKETGMKISPADLSQMLYGNKIPEGMEQIRTEVLYEAGRDELLRQDRTISPKLPADAVSYGNLDIPDPSFHFINESQEASMARGYAMAGGMKLQEILDLPQEDLEALGKEFRDFTNAHPLQDIEDGPEREEMIRDFTEYYEKWGNAILDEKMPACDMTGNGIGIPDARYLETLKENINNYSLFQSRFFREPENMAYVNEEKMGQIRESVIIGQVFLNCAASLYDDRIPAYRRAADLFMVQQFGSMVNGRSLEELGDTFHPGELVEQRSAAEHAFRSLPENRLQEYLNHKADCPVDTAELLSKADVTKGKVKPEVAVADAVKPEKENVKSAEKAPKVSKVQEKNRVKVGFDSLADHEEPMTDKKRTARESAVKKQKTMDLS